VISVVCGTALVGSLGSMTNRTARIESGMRPGTGDRRCRIDIGGYFVVVRHRVVVRPARSSG